jgi:hypothetical protein
VSLYESIIASLRDPVNGKKLFQEAPLVSLIPDPLCLPDLAVQRGDEVLDNGKKGIISTST